MRRLPSLLLAAALAAFALPSAALTPPKRPVTPEDLFAIAFVSSATISHDGKRVVFVVRRADLKQNTYLSNLWIANTGGGPPVQFTHGDHDGEPAWSPDDRTVVFTRAAGGSPQLYAIHLYGGEATRLTNQPHGASGAAFSHDGKHIAFVSTAVDDAPRSRVDWRALGTAPPKKFATTDIRTLPWPRYQLNGGGYIYDKHDHIWTINADGTYAHQLTFSPDGEAGPLWSPDDTRILYGVTALASREADDGHMFVISANGGKPAEVPLPHYGSFPLDWTHDGKHILFAWTSRHDTSSLPALATVDPDGNNETLAIEENSVLIGDAILNDTKEGGAGCGGLTPDDATYIADVSIPGATEIDALTMANGQATTLVGGGREVQDCSLSRDTNVIAYTALDATHLPEIYVFDRTDGKTRQLTHLNDPLTNARALAEPEAHAVQNGKDGTVAYWVMRPPNAVAGRRYPTILDIHGGPHTEFGNSFFHEFQVLAARGFIVVYANPRGSTGYGYDWSSALDGDWGNAMFADENAVMDEVVKRADVDPSRTFVSGGSYGGYATLWMIAHTNRFRAAVAERAVSDIFTETLSADFAAPRGFEGPAGTPHAWGGALLGYRTLWQQSPLAHVTAVHTPLMLIHGDADTRTPIAETLQEYEALKILGRPVELVEFPRETHDLSRTGEPLHRVERLHILTDWFTQHAR